MKDRFMLIAFLTCTLSILQAQEKNDNYHLASLTNTLVKEDVFHTNSQNKFLTSSDFLDAAINSINSLNSLVKKEAYRTKITSFNNPTSSDMGFNLENEIQTALKPLPFQILRHYFFINCNAAKNSGQHSKNFNAYYQPAFFNHPFFGWQLNRAGEKTNER